MVAAVQLAIIVGRAHSGDPVAQFQTAQAAAQIYQAVDAFRQAPVISTVAAAAALRAKLDAEFAEYERLAAEGRHFEAGMALRTAGATLIEISTLGVGTGARVARTAGNVALAREVQQSLSEQPLERSTAIGVDLSKKISE